MKITETKRGKVLKISKQELMDMDRDEIVELYDLDPHSTWGCCMIPISQETSKELAGKLLRPGYEIKLDDHDWNAWFNIKVTRSHLIITTYVGDLLHNKYGSP